MQLKQHLQELEPLFELLPVGVAIARDRECHEMIANTAFREILGIEPETNPSKTGEHAESLPFRVMKDGLEVSPQDQPLQVAAREGVPVNGFCQIVRHDGKTVVLQGKIVPLLDPDGESCGSLGVFVDVTERESLIRELRAAKEAIKTLTGLIPICAHCKNIKDVNNRWLQFEVYIKDHSSCDFTHSICPACADKHWGIAEAG